MGFLDAIEGMASQAMSGGNNANLAQSLMEAVQQHPGGVSGVVEHMQANGTDPATASGGEMAQSLASSGLVENFAAKAGISPEMAQMAMTTLMPMVMSHFAPGGQPAEGGEMASLCEGFLKKFV